MKQSQAYKAPFTFTENTSHFQGAAKKSLAFARRPGYYTSVSFLRMPCSSGRTPRALAAAGSTPCAHSCDGTRSVPASSCSLKTELSSPPGAATPRRVRRFTLREGFSWPTDLRRILSLASDKILRREPSAQRPSPQEVAHVALVVNSRERELCRVRGVLPGEAGRTPSRPADGPGDVVIAPSD
jgi:hypothetical protein